MHDPTDKQLAVLRYIKAYTAEHGYQPNQMGMATHFGWTSANAANSHLTALKKKGCIKIHGPRAVEILVPDELLQRVEQRRLNHAERESGMDSNGLDGGSPVDWIGRSMQPGVG